jgi:hypothetical protein
VARHSPSFNREDASCGAQAEFPVTPTGHRSSPSSSDGLGYRVGQRGLIYVLTVSDLVSLAVNILQNGWTLSECLSRPRSEVIREPFPDEGGSRQNADSLAAMRAALEQTYEAILCTNSWRATKARLGAAVVRSRPMRTIRAFSQRALSPEPARRLIGRRTSFVVDYRPELAAPTREQGHNVSLRG